MCGLAGIITTNRSLEDRIPVVEQMMAKMAHRGPDDNGLNRIGNQALLGHCRLAIIDLELGAQPMQSPDGRYTLVYNGEIYNYLELRQTLIQKGQRFKTFSDTEVLLHLLIQEGVDAVKKLNGMFAFMFHDRQTNEWITARDHFGIKPFYYTRVKDEFVFASEIKSLLAHPDIHARRDDVSLHQYLTFQFCLEDRTLFRDISKIKPGHLLKGRGHEIKCEICYWDTNYNIDPYHTEDYFLDRLRDMLLDSVRMQLRSDVPLGGYLSGGLDSSLVCALASEHLQTPISMFHGRFAEGNAYDESYYARELVNSRDGIYHEAVPTTCDFVKDLPGLIYALDEPLAGPGVFPQYHVSRLAKQHVTVVLGGQGGDEIFGGYARYLVGYLEQALKGSIFETNEEGRHLVTLESIVPQLSLLQQYSPLLSHFWSDGLFEPMDARYFKLIDRSQGLTDILNADLLDSFDREQLFADYSAIFNHPHTKSYINKMTHFDQKTLLPALLQIEDRVSMSVSLESRVPLLDPRIVELVTTMPPQLKFQGGKAKHILKKAVRSLLPATILNRKDKMGFPVPLREWMQAGPVRDFVGDVLLSKVSLERGIFKSDALYAMLSEPGVGARRLWGALCLELWHQQFIDGH